MADQAHADAVLAQRDRLDLDGLIVVGPSHSAGAPEPANRPPNGGTVMAMRVQAIVFVIAVAGLFAFMHSGSRAAALCERDGGSFAEGLSLWPPGARCSGGEPERTWTTVAPEVPLAIPGVALLVFGGAAIAGWGAPRRKSTP
jgi:hypothetical protein